MNVLLVTEFVRWRPVTAGKLDGNERVAFFATDVFLRLNGWKIAVDGNEAHRFLMTNLKAGIYDYRNLQTWIRENLVKI